MKYITDLHIHSKYSRAVSQEMNIPMLHKWGKWKGIQVIGTGDFTHPFWIHHLKENLIKTDTGLYKFKDDNNSNPLFLLTSEISCIYSQGGKVRKIHIVVFCPSIESVEKINNKLGTIGNIMSDGRPILGLSARDLVEIIMEIDKECIIVPAHIWTPWFSLFGANSGFDSIKECFQDLSKYILAVETGLSSDPAMNWRIAELDTREIVSFSDAHSPAKLGREVTVFDGELSYEGIFDALCGEKKKAKIDFTIEFFPEEGKYHFSGHRDCNVRLSPEETLKTGILCPNCGKKITIGVAHRVEELATRKVSDLNVEKEILIKKEGIEVYGIKSKSLLRPSYIMLVPLQEILAEALNVGVGTQKVSEEYFKLINNFKTEFRIFLSTSQEELKKITTERIVEGIQKVREGSLTINPGYDGVFGQVKIWDENLKEENLGNQQMSLF